jgi:hypothetical protein
MDECREDGSASDGDEEEGIGRRASRHAEQHRQPRNDIQEPRPMRGGGRAEDACGGEEQRGVGQVLMNTARVFDHLPKPQVEEIVQHTADMPRDLLLLLILLANAMVKVFSDRTILLDESKFVFERNNETTT